MNVANKYSQEQIDMMRALSVAASISAFSPYFEIHQACRFVVLAESAASKIIAQRWYDEKEEYEVIVGDYGGDFRFDCSPPTLLQVASLPVMVALAFITALVEACVRLVAWFVSITFVAEAQVCALLQLNNDLTHPTCL